MQTLPKCFNHLKAKIIIMASFPLTMLFTNSKPTMDPLTIIEPSYIS